MAKDKIDEIALRVADEVFTGNCEDNTEILQFAHALLAELSKDAEPSFQSRVYPWLIACFGEEISNDKVERNHRFLEESLELVQATGCTQSEAHQLVDYVYGRPTGEPYQEVGGVMVTLAALCLANGLDMHSNGEIELERIWTKVEKIRAKQATKPKHSPLPEHPAPVIASEQKPAIWIQSNHIDNAKKGAFLSRTGPFKMKSDWVPLFTSPPNTSDIEQRVAEAVLLALHDGASYSEISDGKWREYL